MSGRLPPFAAPGGDGPDDALPPALRAAVSELRAPVRPRPEWRAAVLREVAASSPPAGARARLARAHSWLRDAARAAAVRPFAVTPAAAFASALLCAALGAGGTWMAGRGGPPRGDSHPPDAAGASAAAVAIAATPGAAALRAVRDGGRPTTVVRFAVDAPGARAVSVVGSFNGWDPSATPLTRSADGRTWTATLPLPAGRHVYAFAIDGGLSADPAAPRAPEDDFGLPNSVLVVAERST